LAYNNAVFTDEDWNNIQKLKRSNKRSDPFKVGKFGIGFNSVFHVTGLCKLGIRKLHILKMYIWNF